MGMDVPNGSVFAPCAACGRAEAWARWLLGRVLSNKTDIYIYVYVFNLFAYIFVYVYVYIYMCVCVHAGNAYIYT